MIQRRARILFLSLLTFLFLGGGITFYYSYREKKGIFSFNWREEFQRWRENSQKEVSSSPTPSPIPTSRPTPSYVPNSSSKSAPPVRKITPRAVCYRYQVTHLDGSSSYLCYNKQDYDQLVNLGYQLSSAKTFYQFHLDGAQQYQDEYERTGSDIYLQAKESSLKSAQREKEKIDQIILQMQEIEKRGFNR